MEDYFMKKACKHCPFRIDVKPFLTTERAEELAYATENPYNSFSCHKTAEFDENSDEDEMIVTNTTKKCAGFMAMQHSLNGNALPKGFNQPLDECYSDTDEMIDAYREENGD